MRGKKLTDSCHFPLILNLAVYQTAYKIFRRNTTKSSAPSEQTTLLRLSGHSDLQGLARCARTSSWLCRPPLPVFLSDTGFKLTAVRF